MNIEFDAQEYRDLLDILHIADVVMAGHRRAEDPRTQRHRALIQKLYSLTGSAGLERMMSFNENVHKYVPTADFEQGSMSHIVLDEFGDHLFWDHLINRLTERDAVQLAGGMESLQAMNENDRDHLETAIRQHYSQEFEANDVANLRLIERHGGFGTQPVKTSD